MIDSKKMHNAIRVGETVMIQATPGAGKSTEVPKHLADRDVVLVKLGHFVQ